MAKHTGKHSAKRSKAAGVAAFLVLLFSGFLLSTNLRVNRSVVVSNDTAELVEQRVKKVNSLRSEIDALSTRVNDLSKTLDSQNADGSQDSESAGNGTMLPRRGRPGTGGDARRFAAMGEHGRRQRIQRQHQRLRGAPAGHRSRGQRAVGGRRRIHADHGPARIVQLRRTLLRQRAAAARQEVFAAVQNLGDPDQWRA